MVLELVISQDSGVPELPQSLEPLERVTLPLFLCPRPALLLGVRSRGLIDPRRNLLHFALVLGRDLTVSSQSGCSRTKKSSRLSVISFF